MCYSLTLKIKRVSAQRWWHSPICPPCISVYQIFYDELEDRKYLIDLSSLTLLSISFKAHLKLNTE